MLSRRSFLKTSVVAISAAAIAPLMKLIPTPTSIESSLAGKGCVWYARSEFGIGIPPDKYIKWDNDTDTLTIKENP